MTRLLWCYPYPCHSLPLCATVVSALSWVHGSPPCCPSPLPIPALVLLLSLLLSSLLSSLSSSPLSLVSPPHPHPPLCIPVLISTPQAVACSSMGCLGAMVVVVVVIIVIVVVVVVIHSPPSSPSPAVAVAGGHHPHSLSWSARPLSLLFLSLPCSSSFLSSLHVASAWKLS
jgi:hypothetical protein